MAGTKTHPRFKDRLELYRAKTFEKLNVKDVSREELERLDEIFTSFLDTCKKWWWIETGFTLEIIDGGDMELVWTIEDTREASMVFHWLKSKATKYEGRIIKRVNQVINISLKEELRGEGNAP